MKFTLIEGGLGAGERPAHRSNPPDAAAVRAEAKRRLQASGCEAARMRGLLTGRPVPAAMRYLQLQIEYAAEALAGLQPIPSDFRSDRYWPGGRIEAGTGAP